MCIGDYVKNHIVTCQKSMFWCAKGISEFGVLGSPKTHCSKKLWREIVGGYER